MTAKHTTPVGEWSEEDWKAAIEKAPRPIFMEWVQTWMPTGEFPPQGDYLRWLAKELEITKDDVRRIKLLNEVRHHANDELVKQVALVRGDGSDDYLHDPVPWSTIGKALGTTGEAARQKYGDDGRKERLEEALTHGQAPEVVRPGPPRSQS